MAYDVREIPAADWPDVCSIFVDYNYEQCKEYAWSRVNGSADSVQFLVVVDEEHIIGAAIVRKKKIRVVGLDVNYISGGPLVDANRGNDSLDHRKKVLTALKVHLVDKRNQALFFRFPVASRAKVDFETDLLDLGFRLTERVRTYRTILVDVSVDQDEMMRRLAGKWRTDLRFAQKSGLVVECGHDSDYQRRFMRLFGAMRDAKNFDVNVDPSTFFRLPAKELGLKILIATKEGRDVAGHVVSMLGDTSVYLFGATNDLGRTTKAGYLLNWQAMLLAQQNGLDWYDLGGIDPEGNPGVFRFKKKMGGRDLTAIGPYEALPKNFWGMIFEALFKVREAFVKQR